MYFVISSTFVSCHFIHVQILFLGFTRRCKFLRFCAFVLLHYIFTLTDITFFIILFISNSFVFVNVLWTLSFKCYISETFLECYNLSLLSICKFFMHQGVASTLPVSNSNTGLNHGVITRWFYFVNITV